MSAATDLFTARHNLQLPDFPIKNTSGSALTFGMCVKLDTTTPNPVSASQPAVCVIPTAALADMALGVVVDTSIANNAQGRIQSIEGTAVWCIADAANGGVITAGTQVMPSSTVPGSVRAYVSGAGNGMVGMALSTTTTAGDPVLVMLAKHGIAT